MNSIKYAFYALIVFVALQQSDAHGMFGFGQELRSTTTSYGGRNSNLYMEHLAAQREAEEAEAAERYNVLSEQGFNLETVGNTDVDNSTSDIFQFDNDQHDDFGIECYHTPQQAMFHYIKRKNNREKAPTIVLSGDKAVDVMSQEKSFEAQKGYRRTSMRRSVLNKQLDDRAMLTQSK
jgi:hypothetical protein